MRILSGCIVDQPRVRVYASRVRPADERIPKTRHGDGPTLIKRRAALEQGLHALILGSAVAVSGLDLDVA